MDRRTQTCFISFRAFKISEKKRCHDNWEKGWGADIENIIQTLLCKGSILERVQRVGKIFEIVSES